MKIDLLYGREIVAVELPEFVTMLERDGKGFPSLYSNKMKGL